MIRHCGTLAASCALVALTSLGLHAAEQDAIDGCIDRLRAVGGPDGQSGEVLSSDHSEAGTIVMLRDAGGTVWRCLGYNDGSVGELAVAEGAGDGGGAMAGAAGGSAEQRVQFAAGSNAAKLEGRLMPGASMRYVLGARNGQFFVADVYAPDADITFQIFNPDGTFLLEQIPAGTPYEGQLWQSGDHVVEVINRGGAAAGYALGVEIN